MPDADIFSLLQILKPEVKQAAKEGAVPLGREVIPLLPPLLVQRFQTGDKLQPPKALAAEKPVDLFHEPGGLSRYHAEDIVLRSGFFQHAGRPHDLVECAVSRRVPAVAVVDVRRSVQGQSHEEMILCQKAGPFLVHAQSVGLDGIADPHARLAVALLQFQNAAVKIQPRQCRLSALEAKRTGPFGILHGRRHDPLHGLQGHHPLAGLLAVVRHIPIKAVLTVHIAGRGGRFDEYIDSRHRLLLFEHFSPDTAPFHPRRARLFFYHITLPSTQTGQMTPLPQIFPQIPRRHLLHDARSRTAPLDRNSPRMIG